MRVAVEFSWGEIGAITVEGGKLRFRIAPEAPGIYRVDLGDRGVDRRGRPTPAPVPALPDTSSVTSDESSSQHSDASVLGAGGAVTVCTVTEAEVDIDRARAPLDLTRKASRLLVEVGVDRRSRGWRASENL